MKRSKLFAISFLICGLFLFIACEEDKPTPAKKEAPAMEKKAIEKPPVAPEMEEAAPSTEGESADSPATEEKTEEMIIPPGPQLVTNAWMFIAGLQIDPKVAKALLPEGLEPHPNNRAVINMYTVPNAEQTSGFGAYTLTYLTIEVANHDSYTMGAPAGYPGRYFVHYFNDSALVRDFTSRIGIPASPGHTAITVDDEGNLKAVLEVNGKPFITITAKVGSELGEYAGGHLNYFGLINAKEGDKAKQFVVKYPIPYIGATVTTENPVIKITAPPGHPLNKLTPKQIDWAVWMQGSFVYPNPVVVHEIKQ